MSRLKKIYKRVENTGSVKLSSTQEDILYLLLDEKLTIPQIANNRGTSRTAVYNVLEKCKKKGAIKEVEKGSYIKGGYYPTKLTSSDKEYRLHAQNLVVQIMDTTNFYRNLIKSKNKDLFDNNNIMFYEDKLIIYSNKDFWGDSVNQCVRLSLDYWERFFTRVENEYKVILIKGKQRRIREFRGEIAKVGDPLARKIDLTKETFRIYIGGELRLICDRSFKLDELEAVNSNYYIEDMSKIENFYKDLLNTENLALPSELQSLVQGLIKTNLEQTKIIDKLLLTNKEQVEFNKQGQELQRDNMLIMRSLMNEVKELKRR